MAKIVSFGKLLNRVIENTESTGLGSASAAGKTVVKGSTPPPGPPSPEEKFTPDKWKVAPQPPPGKRHPGPNPGARGLEGEAYAKKPAVSVKLPPPSGAGPRVP